MKNDPPMRKWVFLEVIILLGVIVVFFGSLMGKTAWDAIVQFLAQLERIYLDTHEQVTEREGKIYAYVCEILLIGLLIYWIIKTIRNRGLYFLGKLFPEKNYDELRADKKKLGRGEIIFSRGLEEYQGIISDLCRVSSVNGVFYLLNL